MKKIILSIAGILPTIFFNVQARSQSAGNKDITSYFKENVAIVDARVRTVDKENYIKELVVADFKKSTVLPETVDFSGCFFIDNGKGYDKIAGDGIYTSSTHYSHNEKVP